MAHLLLRPSIDRAPKVEIEVCTQHSGALSNTQPPDWLWFLYGLLRLWTFIEVIGWPAIIDSPWRPVDDRQHRRMSRASGRAPRSIRAHQGETVQDRAVELCGRAPVVS
jgi:hypothetical protein